MEKTASLKHFVALILSALLLSSCGTGTTPESERQIVSESSGNSSSSAVISAYRASAAAQVQVTDTSADLEYYPAVSYSDFDLDVSTDGAVEITLDGNGASFDSEDVTLADGVLTISAAGNYLLKGAFAGQIRVEAEKEDNVHLIFDGLTVESSMAPVCIVSAKNAAITLLEGTENTVTDGSDYTFADGEDEPDAALYSKTDLTINGTGALKVNGNYKNGIVSKDDLKIVGGTIIVNAVYNGIKGKDSLTVGGGVVNVTAGNDALKASNDEDPSRGWVVIEDGELRIEAGDDAIHAETWLIVTSGNIRIEQSYEGLEGKRIEIYGGDIDVFSSDDALNAASGSASGEEFGRQNGGFGGQNGMGRGNRDENGGVQNDRTRPDSFGGERPEGFDGQMPEGMTPPEGFDGQMPEGMTPPEGLTDKCLRDWIASRRRTQGTASVGAEKAAAWRAARA